MNISTDIIVIIIFLLFFLAGWLRGFLRSVLGPISLIIASIISVQYYYQQQNIMIALGIGILGPFVLNIIFSLLLKMWHLTISNEKKELSYLSRFFGGCFSLSWRGTILILFLVLIMFIPGGVPYLDRIQRDISASRIYSIVENQFEKYSNSNSFSLDQLTNLLEDPKKRKELESSEEFQTLLEDSTFKAIFSDEEYLKIVEEKDFAKIIGHPNTQKLLQDKNLVKKLMDFQKQLIEEGMGTVETK